MYVAEVIPWSLRRIRVTMGMNFLITVPCYEASQVTLGMSPTGSDDGDLFGDLPWQKRL